MDDKGTHFAIWDVNITTGDVSLSSVTLLVTLQEGAFIRELWEMKPFLNNCMLYFIFTFCYCTSKIIILFIHFELVYELPDWRGLVGGIPPNMRHTFGYIIGTPQNLVPKSADIQVVYYQCSGEFEYPSDESEESMSSFLILSASK